MDKDFNKSLINVNENGIFYKINKFFKNLFHKKNRKHNNIIEKQIAENVGHDNIDSNYELKNSFLSSIQNIENEETKLLKLQKEYENGQIKEEELTPKQIVDLENLYNKQNRELLKNNAHRMEKIKNNPNTTEVLEKIKNIEAGEIKLLKLQQKYENNEISEDKLTDEEKKQLEELYDDQNYWLEKSNSMRKDKILQYKNKMAV